MNWNKIKSSELFKNFMIFYKPLFFFVSLDLLSTYLGTCFLGGYELNGFAITVASKVGYMITAIGMYLAYALNAFVTAYFYNKTDSQIWRIFFVVVWSLMLMDYAGTMLLNSNSLMYAVTGEQIVSIEVFVDKAPAELVEAKQVFEANRNDFCRWFP